MDDECPVEVKREELEKFTTKLLVSGYSKKLAAKIVRNGVDAYRRLCDQVKAGQRPLHRLASKGVLSRFRVKLWNKKEWFRQKKSVTLESQTCDTVKGDNCRVKVHN